MVSKPPPNGDLGDGLWHWVYHNYVIHYYTIYVYHLEFSIIIRIQYQDVSGQNGGTCEASRVNRLRFLRQSTSRTSRKPFMSLIQSDRVPKELEAHQNTAMTGLSGDILGLSACAIPHFTQGVRQVAWVSQCVTSVTVCLPRNWRAQESSCTWSKDMRRAQLKRWRCWSLFQVMSHHGSAAVMSE